MQTVLESLECSYINILNLESEANRNGDTYVREEVFEAKKELIKAIFLLVVTQDVLPTDSRVYLDLIETPIYKESQSEEIKKEFMEKLYKAEILHREKTIGELIEELKVAEKKKAHVYKPAPLGDLKTQIVCRETGLIKQGQDLLNEPFLLKLGVG